MLKPLTLLALLATTHAHYTFHSLTYNGTKSAPWQYVRNWTDTAGWFDSSGIQYFSPLYKTSFNSINLRCNIGAKFAPETLPVQAGTEITFDSADNIWHPGPLMAYMARVPKGKTAGNWDGAGKVWFKVWEDHPYPVPDPVVEYYRGEFEGYFETNAHLNRTVTFKIPASIPNGEYLFRPEHIAVMVIDNPQIYTTCAQISVYGGGNGTPGPLVSIPGLYKESDATWKYDIRKIVGDGYIKYPFPNPGPVVWRG
ncbi:hypothetical protein GLAREA_12998 [Glarea lozoyensis ATCC 20868]|uniref:lytic cellulose monooxygenase (C4-dehydrogenating) n=1 Tax=Glarea lozoyensis (strain ATCC 20868 / MF5171) TaxID=1116229 RepID=S3CXG1_GLAL2|nr:uncharacterized protein GLAREA_12998 [Glarea lozoyensis ATCC 20868]EPE30275.1 hypothetical protein GLAREA_12998 [Glarea lozoyensis ATCC 20868]